MPQQILLRSITPVCSGMHRGALSFSEGSSGKSVLLGDSINPVNIVYIWLLCVIIHFMIPEVYCF